MRQIIVNTEYEFVTEKLDSMGYEIIPVIRSDRVSAPISAHCDVLYNKVKTNHIIISGCQKANFDRIRQSGYNLSVYDGLKPGYRTECGLNFVTNGTLTIRNPDTSVGLVCESEKEISVKQGYTRCSTLVLNANAYITDDPGIYRSLAGSGFECLQVKKEIVRLDGYDYGFIGGASINLGDGNILFCGDIYDREEKNKVIAFAQTHGCRCIFISGYKLTDIGSGIIL